MENVTLGDISNVLVYIVLFVGSIVTICGYVKRLMNNLLKPLNDKIDNNEMSRMKSSLTNLQAMAEAYGLNDGQKANYYDEFDKYIKAGGNSYIKEGHEKLKKEGKI